MATRPTSDPSHKPKDGDITGPIQMDEAAWIILKREESISANKNVNPKDERIMKQTYDMIHEVKLKEAMEWFYEEVIKAAEIENRLTGDVKLANEEIQPHYKVDGDVKLMGARAAPTGSQRTPTGRPPPPRPRQSSRVRRRFRPR